MDDIWWTVIVDDRDCRIIRAQDRNSAVTEVLEKIGYEISHGVKVYHAMEIKKEGSK